MKKYIAAILTALLLFAMVPAQAAETIKLETAMQAMHFEQNEIALPAYEIEGEHYVPVKLIAGVFGGKVAFDETANAVEIINDMMQDYEEQANLFAAFVQNTARNVRDSYHALQFGGEDLGVQMLLIDGHNFVNLNVISEMFGYHTAATDEGLFITNDPLIALDKEIKSALAAYFANQAAGFDSLGEAFGSIDFANYHVIFIGENHAIAANYEIMFEAIRHLSENYGVRYLLEESGYCESMLLNRYLETGDKSLIDEIVSGSEGSFAYTQDIYNFYVRLYEYNRTLPEDSKLFYLGLDVQHNADKGQVFLLSLFGTEEEMLESILAGKALLQAQDWKALETQVKENQADYETYFAEEYRQFYYGLRSVMQSAAFYETRDFDLREEYFHENFRDMYADYEVEKCFGMFGSAHVFKDNDISDGMPNLASYINEQVDDVNVLSIVNHYANSYYMMQNAQGSAPVDPTMGQIIDGMLREASGRNTWTLFPVYEQNTPLYDTMLGGMMDYILLVKNSPAATPYAPAA